jgi:hypothetical protein
VPAAALRREAQHEEFRSGALDVALLRCPACGLVLAAEVAPPIAGAAQLAVPSTM